MPLDWDDAKRAKNLAKHGFDFALVDQFDWRSALVRADVRFDYGEVRLVAIGRFSGDGNRLASLTFTIRRNALRVISLRAASRREIRSYVAQDPTE